MWKNHANLLGFIIAGSILIFLFCCIGFCANASSPETTIPSPQVTTTSPIRPTTPAPKVTTPQVPIKTTPTEVTETQEAIEEFSIVHPGAYCDHRGDIGVTESGTSMVCKGIEDLRWRKK